MKKNNTHFAACVVPKVVPVDFELAMVVHMDEFVSEGLLHMLFVHKVTLAKNYGAHRIKASCANGGTRHADYIVWWDRTPGQLQVFEHKCHGRTYDAQKEGK